MYRGPMISSGLHGPPSCHPGKYRPEFILLPGALHSPVLATPVRNGNLTPLTPEQDKNAWATRMFRKTRVGF